MLFIIPERSFVHTEDAVSGLIQYHPLFCRISMVHMFQKSVFPDRKSNRYGEIELWVCFFVLFFFKLVTLEEKMTLYFVTQTGDKQHMALLTELQNQNWQILEEMKLNLQSQDFNHVHCLGFPGVFLLLLSSHQDLADSSLASHMSKIRK